MADNNEFIIIKTYNLENGFVLGQSLHTQPVTQIFQNCSIRKVVTCLISLKDDLHVHIKSSVDVVQCIISY